MWWLVEYFVRVYILMVYVFLKKKVLCYFIVFVIYIFYNRGVFIIEKIWFFIYKFLYIGIKLCGDVDE